NRFEIAGMVPNFEAWLRERLVDNVKFDKLVTELITAPVAPPRNPSQPPVPVFEFADPFNGNGKSPLAFYYAKDAEAENCAAAASRVFLGVQIECAQCHAHPFARWTRDQFWGMAGFFAGIEPTQRDNVFGPLREVFDRRELAIPNTDIVVQATFLDD